MTTFALTLGLFVVVTFAMALGVMISGRRLAGSCGGVAGKDCSCSATDRKVCEERAASKAVVHEDDGARHLDVMQGPDSSDS